MNRNLVLALGSIILLAGCGSEPGGGTSNGSAAAAPEAAEDGPAGASKSVAYPGSRVEGDRFSTSDPVDKVLAWYWNPDQPMVQRNGQLWTVSKPERRTDGHLVQMTIVGDEDGQTYAVYLNPGASGGTEGRIRTITDEELRSGVKL